VKPNLGLNTHNKTASQVHIIVVVKPIIDQNPKFLCAKSAASLPEVFTTAHTKLLSLSNPRQVDGILISQTSFLTIHFYIRVGFLNYELRVFRHFSN
jgi:hypothetical protein